LSRGVLAFGLFFAVRSGYNCYRRQCALKPITLEKVVYGLQLISGRLYDRTPEGLFAVTSRSVKTDASGQVLDITYTTEASSLENLDESILAASVPPIPIDLSGLPSFLVFIGVELVSGVISVTGVGWREADWLFTARHLCEKPCMIGYKQDLWLFRDPKGRRVRVPYVGTEIEMLFPKAAPDDYHCTGADLVAIKVGPVAFADIGVSTAKRTNYSSSGTGCVTAYGVKDGLVQACRGVLHPDASIQASRGVIGHTCGTFPGTSGSPCVQIVNGRACIIGMHICWNGLTGPAAQNFAVTIHAILALRKKCGLDGGIVNALLQALYPEVVEKDESPGEKCRQAAWEALEEEALQRNRTKAEHRANLGDEKRENNDADDAKRHAAKLLLAAGRLGNPEAFQGKNAFSDAPEGVSSTNLRGARQSWADVEDSDYDESVPVTCSTGPVAEILDKLHEHYSKGLKPNEFVYPDQSGPEFVVRHLFAAFPGVWFTPKALGKQLCIGQKRVHSMLDALVDAWYIRQGNHGWRFIASEGYEPPDFVSLLAGDPLCAELSKVFGFVPSHNVTLSSAATSSSSVESSFFFFFCSFFLLIKREKGKQQKRE